jgi:phosphohistidine phosphatase
MTGTNPQARRLVLLRHGKSAYPGGVMDHDRPLAPRGRREAALAGRAILDLVGRVDAVLCSTATRTRETLQATGIDAMVHFDDGIYEASPGEILDRITALDAALDDSPGVLVVVGHAPGMPATALRLADERSDPGAVDQAQRHFPTSALALLSVHGAWADLAADGATLTDLVIARDSG